MNEFTKEELETLAACVSVYVKDDPDDYMPLFDKICQKINNHCEHDWENTCCQCEMNRIYCHKCERTFDEIR